jgi:lipopolysaccharide/colanic/teichoic acid biosynthesis glycosyltransferase
VRRALDVVLCVAALPLVLPVCALVALAVWLDSPGPVLYRAPRLGQHGRPFLMFKFRSMRHGMRGPSITSADDDRFTPVGRWLRRHRLDELPQVLNVLRGDMRLVGPRPELAEFVTANADRYTRIHAVRPGMTGPTQLAFADEEQMLAGADDRVALYEERLLPSKMELDMRFVEFPSVRGDLAVLCRTLVLRPKRRDRVGAALLGVAGPAVAPSTRSVVALSLLALVLSAVFAVDAGSG